MAVELASLITLAAVPGEDLAAALNTARLPGSARALELIEHPVPRSRTRLLTLDERDAAGWLWALAAPLGPLTGGCYFYQWDDRARAIELWRFSETDPVRLFLDHDGEPADLAAAVERVFSQDVVETARAAAHREMRDRYAGWETDARHAGLAEALCFGEPNASRWDERLFVAVQAELDAQLRRALLDAAILFEIGVEHDALLSAALRPDRYRPRLLTVERRPGFLGIGAGPWTVAAEALA